MKKLIITAFIGAVLAAQFALPTFAKSDKAKGPVEKATGGVTATAGGATLQLEFNAHGSIPVKGIVHYSNSLGGYFTGDVDLCYAQKENEAAFAGTVTSGTYSEPYFLIEVQDNGEGEEATTPDAVRVRVLNTEPDCEIGELFPGVVTEGNLQVHKEVAEPGDPGEL